MKLSLALVCLALLLAGCSGGSEVQTLPAHPGDRTGPTTVVPAANQ